LSCRRPKAQKDRDIAVPKADLGVVHRKTNQTAADKLGMKEPKGVRIVYIGPNSVAFDSGLHLEDVILKFGDKTMD